MVETVGLVPRFGPGLSINLTGGEGECTAKMREYGVLFSFSYLPFSCCFEFLYFFSFVHNFSSVMCLLL